MSRLIHPPRCDCWTCFSVHLVTSFLLIGLAVGILLAGLVSSSDPERLLIEDTTSKGGGAW